MSLPGRIQTWSARLFFMRALASYMRRSTERMDSSSSSSPGPHNVTQGGAGRDVKAFDHVMPYLLAANLQRLNRRDDRFFHRVVKDDQEFVATDAEYIPVREGVSQERGKKNQQRVTSRVAMLSLTHFRLLRSAIRMACR